MEVAPADAQITTAEVIDTPDTMDAEVVEVSQDIAGVTEEQVNNTYPINLSTHHTHIHTHTLYQPINTPTLTQQILSMHSTLLPHQHTLSTSLCTLLTNPLLSSPSTTHPLLPLTPIPSLTPYPHRLNLTSSKQPWLLR